MSSILDDAEDPFNFSVYMDKVHPSAVNASDNFFAHHSSFVMQAPLTISINSPLELVQQFFVKLGARYVVVTDPNGNCELFPLFFFESRLHLSSSLDEGVIDKNGWLAFLGELEMKSG